MVLFGSGEHTQCIECGDTIAYTGNNVDIDFMFCWAEKCGCKYGSNVVCWRCVKDHVTMHELAGETWASTSLDYVPDYYTQILKVRAERGLG